MKRVEVVRSRKKNDMSFKIIILLTIAISVFTISYMFGLKIVRDSQLNHKTEDSINTLLERAKPKQ